MLEGEAEFIVGGESKIVRAGDQWCIPGGVVHKVIAGDSLRASARCLLPDPRRLQNEAQSAKRGVMS